MFRRLNRFASDDRGVAAIEMALVGSFFVMGALNAIDLGRYAYVTAQLQDATQVAAQAALVACDTAHLPATTNCTNLNSAVDTALRSTPLGPDGTLTSAVAEGFYCLNASNALQYVSDVNHKPLDCTAAGQPALSPVDYLQVTTSYSYQPLFANMTVVAALPSELGRTAWMRMQ
ncbi:MAG: hypothetical protein JWQ52_1647 [Phenylobacterium sp.]|jgi:Flp pilus assembly protein TadG|nr:hypothetical protein [Phenylobacterium sp.]